MPLTLYSIPFTFTLTGIRLIAAATPHEAADIAAKDMSFEEANLYESCVFWDEGARVDKIQCTPAFGPATPYEGNPEDQGFFPEDLEMEEETRDRREHEMMEHDIAAKACETASKSGGSS